MDRWYILTDSTRDERLLLTYLVICILAWVGIYHYVNTAAHIIIRRSLSLFVGWHFVMLDYGVGLHAWDVSIKSYTKFAEVPFNLPECEIVTDRLVDHQHTADRIHAFHSLYEDLDFASITSDMRPSKTELSMVYSHSLDWSQRSLFHNFYVSGNIRMCAAREDMASYASWKVTQYREDFCRNRCN